MANAPILSADLCDKLSALQGIGLDLFPRNPARNRDFSGAWMVAQPLEDGEDPATTGAWCIVGDQPDALIQEAFEVWQPEIADAMSAKPPERVRRPRAF